MAELEPDAELSGIFGFFTDEGHVSPAADIAEEMRAAGYRSARSFDFLPVRVFEVFTPEGDAH